MNFPLFLNNIHSVAECWSSATAIAVEVSVSISCHRRTAMYHSGATTSKHVRSRTLNPTRLGKLTHLEVEPRLRAAETHCSRYGTVGAQFYQAVAAAGTWASRDAAQAADESRATSKTAAASAASSWDTGVVRCGTHMLVGT